jgi:L-rhamnose mutarotase
MRAVDGGDFDYAIAAMCSKTGALGYRYTVYQRSPREQRLLFGFKETQEEAERIAEAYTRIAAEAWKQHCVSCESVKSAG